MSAKGTITGVLAAMLVVVAAEPASATPVTYDDPTTFRILPFNPARFLPQRHVVFGLAVRF